MIIKVCVEERGGTLNTEIIPSWMAQIFCLCPGCRNASLLRTFSHCIPVIV